MKPVFSIGNFKIGPDSPVFIIAELSANHNGSFQNAIDTIKAAKRAGADAIKLQTYTADTITIDSKKADFKIIDTIWDGKYLHDLYKEAYTPWEWHERLFVEAEKEGLYCFSSPFDHTAVDFLETFNPVAYKIASFEITDIPLIEYVAHKKRPVIISTGIAEEQDIELAVKTCLKTGNDNIALLQCTSSYPAPIEEANLSRIRDLSEKFQVAVGLSDHTMGITAPVVATALGAKIIEKHFIIDRSIGGPDASFSLNEAEFTAMVTAVRETEKSLGTPTYHLTVKQKKSRDFARSLYVVQDVKKGDVITDDNVRSIRPGFGLHPKYLSTLLGKKFTVDAEKGDRMRLDMTE